MTVLELVLNWLIVATLGVTVLAGLGLLYVQRVSHPAKRVAIMRCALFGVLLAPFIALTPGYPSLFPDGLWGTAQDWSSPVVARDILPAEAAVAADRPLDSRGVKRVDPAVYERIKEDAEQARRAQEGTDGESQPAEPEPATTRPVFPRTQTVPITTNADKPAALGPGNSSMPPAALPSTEDREQASFVNWPLVMVAFYAAGLLLFGVRSLLGLAALTRLKRHSREADAWIIDACGQFGEVAVRQSDQIDQPIAFGCFSPTIVFPENMSDSDREMRWALAHEFWHVRNGDTRFWPFVCVAKWMFFFHPFVWWMSKQLYLNQDYLADQFAAQQDASAADYAEFLVSLSTTRKRLSWGLGMSGGKSDLYRRVIMVVKTDNPSRQTFTRRWRIVATSAVLAVMAITASLARPLFTSTAQAAPPADDKAASSNDENVKTAAGRTVAKKQLRYMGQSFEQWKFVLESDLDPKTRQGAIVALEAFGLNGYQKEAAAAIGPFVVYEQSREVVDIAIRALRRLKGAQELEYALKRATKNHTAIIHALGSIGKDAQATAPTVAAIGLNHKDSDIRVTTAYALGSLGNTEKIIIVRLRKSLDDSDQRVTTNGALALLRLQKADEETYHTIAELFRAGEAQAVSELIYSIGEYAPHDKRLIDQLRASLDLISDDNKVAALRVLGNSNNVDEATINIAIRLLAATGTGRSGLSGPARSAFQFIAKHGKNNTDVREALARAYLLATRYTSSTRFVSTLFADANKEVAVAALTLVLEDVDLDERVRLTIYSQLSQFEEAAVGALPVLTKYLNTPHERRRTDGGRYIDERKLRAVLRVLRSIGPKAKPVLPTLNRMIESDTNSHLSTGMRYDVEKTIKALMRE